MTSSGSLEFRCPTCGGNGADLLQLPNPMVVHWVINPGLVINELLLGQRLPRVGYICIKCDLPRMERSYVGCPSCGKFHPGRVWGRGNAFGHWFGLFCPDCSARIPSLLNLLTIAVAVVLAPLWWPLWLLMRRRWIAWEVGRAQRVKRHLAAAVPRRTNWIRNGALGWGGFMWMVMNVRSAIQGPRDARLIVQLIVSLPFWLALGALWGWWMDRYLSRRHRFTPGHCRQCGYKLHGLLRGVCPECGFEFAASDQAAAP